MRRGGGTRGNRSFGQSSERQRNRSSDKDEHSSRARRDPSVEKNIEDLKKKKFTNRCRLFVGNLAPDVKDSDLREQFAKFGEIAECTVSSKGVAFVRLDTRANTELAKEKMDGFLLKGRALRIRFALNPATIRVKELSPYVSNELLYEAFSRMGDVERAVHFSDDKGRPLGEGVVEFARRGQAEDCTKIVSERVFLLTTNPKPIVCEKIEGRDEEDGLPDAVIPRGPQYTREREMGTRYAKPGTFEFEFGMRWKQLYHDEKLRREQLEREFKEARHQLESEMDIAYQKFKAEQIREELKRRQEELSRLEAETQERLEMASRRFDDDRYRSQNFGGSSQNVYGIQAGIESGFGPTAQMLHPGGNSAGMDEQLLRLGRDGPVDQGFVARDTFGLFPGPGLSGREFVAPAASSFGGFENGGMPAAFAFGGNDSMDFRDRRVRSPELPWNRGGSDRRADERRRNEDSKRRRHR